MYKGSRQNTKVTVAIAGFGFMGRTHYGNWKKLKGAKVVAICDSNLAQLKNKVKGNVGDADGSTDFSGIEVYSDFDEMLAKCGCDLVDVTLPTPLHPQMVEAALASGRHVICEKPMAIDARTCDAMLVAVGRAKGKFMVAQCLRFQAEHVYVKRLIDSGRYGSVVSADFARVSMTPGWGAGGGKSWFLDEGKSGGVALDLHIHDTDLVNWWFGRPESLTSRELRRADGVGMHIATSYAYPDKVVNAVGSWVDAPSFVFEASFRVVFERAVVVCDTRRTPSFVVYPAKGKPFTPKFRNADGYFNELKAFLEWTRSPSAESPFDAHAARDSVAIVDAERESAKTGRTVVPSKRNSHLRS